MQLYHYPNEKEWEKITKRATLDAKDLSEIIEKVFTEVKNKGDEALKAYTLQFDKVALEALQVSAQEIENAVKNIDPALKKAIDQAYQNIRTFHSYQKENFPKVEVQKGITCWRKSIGIERVGFYIPGGSAPLFSTVLMLGVPAQIAECKQRIVCTPPNAEGNIHPAIIYAAQLTGVHQIFKVGGAQAIAAMGLGTESIPQCYKIFGPGNQYVTAAKMMLAQKGVAIDMPAGPSEVLVVADASCYPAFVAADLLSQAEHGADSQVVLLSTDSTVAEAVLKEVKKQVEILPRKEIAEKALQNSLAVVLKEEDIMPFSNYYAPEHLILAVARPEQLAEQVINAGSVFLGHYTPEAVGDYASGTNHTLPTNGYAKAYSGVSLDSFFKKITFQSLTKEGLQNLSETVQTMAQFESLTAHQNAIAIRLEN